MAIVYAFNFSIRQYNAINAFTNASLIEQLAGQCAEGFRDKDTFWWILKGLYGLRILPLLWYKHFTATLEDLGFKPVLDTNCLFVSKCLTLIFYINNILLLYAEKDKHLADEFEGKLLKRYEMQILGDADHFLGICIVRNRDNCKLWLLQDLYINKLTEKFNLILS